ncbi:MAG: LamG domain-containing protein [Planctomycetota bacterium]
MAISRQVDFEPDGWREFAQPPAEWWGYAERVRRMGPLAYWRLADAAGEPATDEMGTLDGSYGGATDHTAAGPLYRDPQNAAGFLGDNASISVPSTDLLNGVSACTILFWMRYSPSAVNQDGHILSRWPSSSVGGWMVWADASAYQSGRSRTVSFAADIFVGQDVRVEGSADLVVPGVWSFYACTFQGGDALRIYKDGVLDREASTSAPVMTTTSNPTWIGRSAAAASNKSFRGDLAELAVFDRALSAQDIESLHGVGRGQLRLADTGG